MKYAGIHYVLERKHVVSLWRLRESLLSCVLIVQLLILFAMPTVRSMGWPLPHIAVDCILLFFVFLAALLSRSRWAMISISISLCLAIAGVIWSHEEESMWSESFNFAGQFFTQVSLLWIVSTAVFGTGRITIHRILGAVVMYLCIGMIFASADMFIAKLIPDAFTNLPADHYALHETMDYFSFSALTTCNFGDIAPVHPVVRSLATVEAVIGQLFPPIFIARVVNQHQTSRHRKY